MKRIFLTITLILWASTAGAMSPGFWAAVTTGGAPASGSFLLDEFDESSSTIITSHAPDIGSSWGAWELSSIATVGAGTGSVTAAGLAWNYNTATPTSANYTVTVKGIVPSTSWDVALGAMARMDAGKNGYAARLEGGGALKIMRKVPSDSDWWMTEIGTPGTVSGFSTSTVYTITLTINGSSLTAMCYDGATIKATATATDSTHAGAGYAGYFIRGAKVYSIEAK